jgi:hypothetical protein
MFPLLGNFVKNRLFPGCFSFLSISGMTSVRLILQRRAIVFTQLAQFPTQRDGESFVDASLNDQECQVC